MTDDRVPSFQSTIRVRYGCAGTLEATVPVVEGLEGRTLFADDVFVFRLVGHPWATRCYVWEERDAHASHRRTALHTRATGSPRAAVRASVVPVEKERLRRRRARIGEAIWVASYFMLFVLEGGLAFGAVLLGLALVVLLAFRPWARPREGAEDEVRAKAAIFD